MCTGATPAKNIRVIRFIESWKSYNLVHNVRRTITKKKSKIPIKCLIHKVLKSNGCVNIKIDRKVYKGYIIRPPFIQPEVCE
jgi:hypothetical protein